MRYSVWIIIFMLLALGVSKTLADGFYGTGSSYTGTAVPIQRLNAIAAEKRHQSAIESELRSRQLQLQNDEIRARTTGLDLGCTGKVAAQTGCATKPMPEFDRRRMTLEQQSAGAARQSEARARKLQGAQ